MRRLVPILLLAVTAAAPLRAHEAPSGVLSLGAAASVEVVHDLFTVVLAATHDGADAAGVQRALRQALDTALAEARRAVRPGQLEVRSGNFSLYPRHGDKGQIQGWQGSAELLIEGRDREAIAQLAGRIRGMAVARVGQSLSREQRQRAESELAAEAIGRFRARAAEYAKQFGYASVVMREVSVSHGEPPVVPLEMARARTMQAADESLPIEPGKATVTVSVNGSVQMLK